LNHLHIYACPASARLGPERLCGPRTLQSVLCSEADISASNFSITFEQSVQRLQHLQRLFIELDGSFVWCGQADEQAWQIDGMLYDSQERVQRLELKGDGPPQAWRSLLNSLDWPQQRVLAHWIEWQCFEEITEPLQLGWWAGEAGQHHA
jgi:hypothetical protein